MSAQDDNNIPIPSDSEVFNPDFEASTVVTGRSLPSIGYDLRERMRVLSLSTVADDHVALPDESFDEQASSYQGTEGSDQRYINNSQKGEKWIARWVYDHSKENDEQDSLIYNGNGDYEADGNFAKDHEDADVGSDTGAYDPEVRGIPQFDPPTLPEIKGKIADQNMQACIAETVVHLDQDEPIIDNDVDQKLEGEDVDAATDVTDSGNSTESDESGSRTKGKNGSKEEIFKCPIRKWVKEDFGPMRAAGEPQETGLTLERWKVREEIAKLHRRKRKSSKSHERYRLTFDGKSDGRWIDFFVRFMAFARKEAMTEKEIIHDTISTSRRSIGKIHEPT